MYSQNNGIVASLPGYFLQTLFVLILKTFHTKTRLP